jgi:hypothetical protein
MATTVMPNTAAPKLRPGRRYDNRFVSFMVALLLATVLYGFARSYFLAGVFRAPLPNTLIHIHGAVFTCWMLLLITQTSLISTGRVDIHRKLGLAGFGLACLMIILGVLAATDALARNFVPSGAAFDAKTFYTVPMGDMLIFSTIVFFAYRFRSNPSIHKRLILIASIALMDAPLGRVPFLNQSHLVSDIACYSFFVLLFLYDWWSTGKIQRVTIWATLFVIIVEELRVPVGMTAPWHVFATWMQTHHF